MDRRVDCGQTNFNVLLYLKSAGCLIDEVDLSFEGSFTLTGADQETVDRGLD